MSPSWCGPGAWRAPGTSSSRRPHLGLKAGSVYPILMRLADRGLLETAWETDPPASRPPCHLYRLTGPGRALAGRLAAEAPARPRPGPPRRRAATATGGHMSTAGVLEALAGTEVRQ
jgi:DNA-binding PadR family transcriptional regulator